MEREVTLTEREFLADAKVKLYHSKSHFQDFVDCVHTRRRPICDVAIGASTVIACHVMNFRISIRRERAMGPGEPPVCPRRQGELADARLSRWLGPVIPT